MLLVTQGGGGMKSSGPMAKPGGWTEFGAQRIGLLLLRR